MNNMKKLIYLLLLITLAFCTTSCESEKEFSNISLISSIQGTYISTETMRRIDICCWPKPRYAPEKQIIEISQNGHFKHTLIGKDTDLNETIFVNLDGQLIEDPNHENLYVKTTEDLVKIEFLTVGHFLFVRYNSDKRTELENDEYLIFHYGDDNVCYVNDYLQLWDTKSKEIAQHQGIDTIGIGYSYFSNTPGDTVQYGEIPQVYQLGLESKDDGSIQFVYLDKTTSEFKESIRCEVRVRGYAIEMLLYDDIDPFKTSNLNLIMSHPLYNNFQQLYTWDVVKSQYPELRHPSQTN